LKRRLERIIDLYTLEKKALSPTPGIVHCRQSALAFIGSIAYLSCTRTSERSDPGNEPYPKTLGTMQKN